MSNNDHVNQVSQGCCGSANESFDCAAMMEQFKNCCESAQWEEDTDCCAEMLKACCDTSEKNPDK